MNSLSILLLNHAWFAEELREMGHQVVTLGLGGSHLAINLKGSAATVDQMLQALPQGFQPDRIVWFDDSGVPWLVGLEELAIPKIFFSVDSHHHVGWHQRFAGLFDAVLVAQRDHVAAFQTVCENTQWFPPWATRWLEPATARTIDVAFRGTLDPKLHPKRAAFFDRLCKLVTVDAAKGDYAVCYPRAKIVVNQAVSNDLNFRVFEAMSAGALLITPEDQMGLAELFCPGEDLVTYKTDNADDAAEKVRYYLTHEREREKIAQSGYEKVIRQHSSAVRAQQLAEHISALRPSSRPQKNFDAAFLYVFAHMVRQNVGLDVQDHCLIFGALKALYHYLQQTSSEPKGEVLALVMQAYENFRQSDCEHLFLKVLKELSRKLPHNQLPRIMLASVALSCGDRAAIDEQATALGTDPDTLVTHLPTLLAAAREDFSISQ